MGCPGPWKPWWVREGVSGADTGQRAADRGSVGRGPCVCTWQLQGPLLDTHVRELRAWQGTWEGTRSWRNQK